MKSLGERGLEDPMCSRKTHCSEGLLSSWHLRRPDPGGCYLCLGFRAAGSMQGTQSIGSLSSGDLEDPDFSKEQDVEAKCARAFKAVLHFEQTHCLQVEVGCSAVLA